MIDILPSYFKDPHTLAGLDEREPVLVALSGGSDSSALLHLLCVLKQKRDFPLYAAHVNHNIRTEAFGNEAARDEAFCASLCSSLGVELFVHRADVPQIAQTEGKSIETAARDVRYDFFAKIMEQKGIRILATAHNADDNLETQIFNLCRGCGIEGISGIPTVRPLDRKGQCVAVRPLLSATKQEIFELCRQNHIEYVSDSTNFEDDCTRNKLRLNLIPMLREIFPSPEKSGARLSDAAREDNDFITSEAKRFLEGCESINTCQLSTLHPAVAKRVIKLRFDETFAASLEKVHVDEVLKFAASGKNGCISLPSLTKAVFTDGVLTFEPDKTEKDAAESYEFPLSEGFNIINGTLFAVCITKCGCNQPIIDVNYSLYASADLKGEHNELYARNRRAGDAILDGGVHKKLKKLMCDKKVPLSDRDTLPLIISREEIIYTPLCAISDIARAKKAEREFNISIYKLKQKIQSNLSQEKHHAQGR